jgi:hypothetical protein
MSNTFSAFVLGGDIFEYDPQTTPLLAIKISICGEKFWSGWPRIAGPHGLKARCGVSAASLAAREPR